MLYKCLLFNSVYSYINNEFVLKSQLPKELVVVLVYRCKGAQGMVCVPVDCTSLYKGQVKSDIQMYVHKNVLKYFGITVHG